MAFDEKNRKRAYKPRFREPAKVTENPITIDELDSTLCVSIWCCVLAQLLCDLAGIDLKARREAERWVASRDFNVVCDFACMEASVALSVINKINTNPEFAASFRVSNSTLHNREVRPQPNRGRPRGVRTPLAP